MGLPPDPRGAGGRPKRRSYARDGVGSVQGSIHSASSQACRRISPGDTKNDEPYDMTQYDSRLLRADLLSFVADSGHDNTPAPSTLTLHPDGALWLENSRICSMGN